MTLTLVLFFINYLTGIVLFFWTIRMRCLKKSITKASKRAGKVVTICIVLSLAIVGAGFLSILSLPLYFGIWRLIKLGLDYEYDYLRHMQNM